MDGHMRNLGGYYAVETNDWTPHPRKAKKDRFTMERSKRYAALGLTAGIFCGFLLCLWSKPIFPCLTTNCCLKQQLREEIRLEIDSQVQQQANQKNSRLKQVSSTFTCN